MAVPLPSDLRELTPEQAGKISGLFLQKMSEVYFPENGAWFKSRKTVQGEVETTLLRIHESAPGIHKIFAALIKRSDGQTTKTDEGVLAMAGSLFSEYLENGPEKLAALRLKKSILEVLNPELTKAGGRKYS